MKIPVVLQGHSYDVILGDLPSICINKKLAIITNKTVSSLHLEHLKQKLKAQDLVVVEIPDGEQYKNLQTIESILNQLFTARLNRSSVLLAFGGGVISDMTGFCASIYQRGIEFFSIPTTLLAMVDASVGGKTGVNNSFGKNLIGSFYQPSSVYIDTFFLSTLPKNEFLAGLAEIIKMAIMFDLEFFNWLEKTELNNAQNIQKAIEKSVSIKAKIVSLDEKESGIRAVLNYGHTFGHVIENETNYSLFLHGECVAIGMVMANALALELGLLTEQENQKITNLLKKRGLPTSYEIQDINSFYEAFFLDKKSKDKKLTFILPRNIGSHVIKDDIQESVIKKALKLFAR